MVVPAGVVQSNLVDPLEGVSKPTVVMQERVMGIVEVEPEKKGVRLFVQPGDGFVRDLAGIAIVVASLVRRVVEILKTPFEPVLGVDEARAHDGARREPVATHDPRQPWRPIVDGRRSVLGSMRVGIDSCQNRGVGGQGPGRLAKRVGESAPSSAKPQTFGAVSMPYP